MKGQICAWCSAALLGAVAGGVLVKKVWRNKYQAQKAELDLTKQQYARLRAWMELARAGQHCADYFTAHNLKTAAILGMNWEGRLLADLLGETAVYGVELDNFSAVHERMVVYRLGEDPLPEADCLVICDLDRLEQKKQLAENAFRGKIVTLTEILEWGRLQKECASDMD